MKPQKTIIIDGIYATGKKTITRYLKEKYSSEIQISVSNLLRQFFSFHWDDWPKKTPIKNIDYYIIFEASPSICLKRKPNNYITTTQLFYERYKYRQLACFYEGIHLIDTDQLSIDSLLKIIESIIFNKNTIYEMPVIDLISLEQFNKMPLVIDTNSKVVRKYNNMYHIIKFKPNVYSFVLKGVHEILESDLERLKLTKDFIELLSREEIPHSYYYVGYIFILTLSLDKDIDLPPIETIVKQYYIGGDKHNYFELNKLITKQKIPVCNCLNKYNKLVVRFDYRNPEYNPQTNQILGDICLCDDLANQLINVNATKQIVKKTFNVLRKHLNKMGLEFYDMCAFVTKNGDMLYAEISQDCTKIRPSSEEKLNEEEKLIWKSGGSTEKYVLQKYQFLTNISHKYIKQLFDLYQ